MLEDNNRLHHHPNTLLRFDNTIRFRQSSLTRILQPHSLLTLMPLIDPALWDHQYQI